MSDSFLKPIDQFEDVSLSSPNPQPQNPQPSIQNDKITKKSEFLGPLPLPIEYFHPLWFQLEHIRDDRHEETKISRSVIADDKINCLSFEVLSNSVVVDIYSKGSVFFSPIAAKFIFRPNSDDVKIFQTSTQQQKANLHIFKKLKDVETDLGKIGIMLNKKKNQDDEDEYMYSGATGTISYFATLITSSLLIDKYNPITRNMICYTFQNTKFTQSQRFAITHKNNGSTFIFDMKMHKNGLRIQHGTWVVCSPTILIIPEYDPKKGAEQEILYDIATGESGFIVVQTTRSVIPVMVLPDKQFKVSKSSVYGFSEDVLFVEESSDHVIVQGVAGLKHKLGIMFIYEN